ncbi:MAG: hypothetical protein P1U54_01830 [Immundisolibacteraceae bacterium]|nr:hypothetical protein [Immundisolibacteraceae bacterium]
MFIKGWLQQLPVITLISLLCSPLQAANEPTARLFYTPQERARLDTIRLSGIETLRSTTDQDSITAKTVTLSGILKKRQGGLRAWVNGKPLDASATDLPVRAGRDLTEQNQLPLLLPGGLTADPKVGQVVNLLNGELTEGYQQPWESPPLTADTVSSPPVDSEDTPDEQVTD